MSSVGRTLRSWFDHVRAAIVADRASAAVWAACLVAALVPLFAAGDLPLIDLPSHLGAVHIWSHHDDATLGYSKYYDLHVQAAPYWIAYGFVKIGSAVMSLAAAAKLFLALAIVGMALGLRALIAAHRGPTQLAIAGLLIGWGTYTQWGMLSFVGAIGPLLYGYALLARLADAGPRPSRRLLVGVAAIGIVLQFSHPIALLLWLAAIPIYLRSWKGAVVAAPSIVLFVWQLAMAPGARPTGAGVIRIQGLWRTPGEAVRHLPDTLAGFHPGVWQPVFVIVLVAALIGALVLAKREPARDRRPLALAIVLALAYLCLPLHLEKPVGFAGMSTRVPPVLALAMFAIVARAALPGWRRLAVAAPLALAVIVHGVVLFATFLDFDRKTEAFHEVVELLPRNPRVLTLIWRPGEDGLDHPWQKFPCYVLIARGGYAPCLWEADQGIGAIEFPVGYKKDARPPAPPLAQPDAFRWPTHGAAYDYFLTKDEPPTLFATQPDLVLVGERAPWRLWKRR